MTNPDSNADLARATLALDEIFINGLPREELAAIKAHLPPGALDQMEAAAAETAKMLTYESTITGTDIFQTASIDVPEWVRLPLLETLLTWVAGQGKVCAHDPRASHPQPVLAAAFTPGLVVCVRCVRLLTPPKRTWFDCDCCGRQDDHLTTQRLIYNHLSYIYGACRDCTPNTPAGEAT